jgi:hypothetical protein
MDPDPEHCKNTGKINKRGRVKIVKDFFPDP